MIVNIHKNARTTPAIRDYIRESSKSLVVLSKELGLNVKTVSKWRKRSDNSDLSHIPHNLAISLSGIEEEIVCYLRSFARLSIEDLCHVVQECVNPSLSSSAIYRCLRRHSLNHLPPLIDGDGDGDDDGAKQRSHGEFASSDNEPGLHSLYRKI